MTGRKGSGTAGERPPRAPHPTRGREEAPEVAAGLAPGFAEGAI